MWYCLPQFWQESETKQSMRTLTTYGLHLTWMWWLGAEFNKQERHPTKRTDMTSKLSIPVAAIFFFSSSRLHWGAVVGGVQEFGSHLNCILSARRGFLFPVALVCVCRGHFISPLPATLCVWLSLPKGEQWRKGKTPWKWSARKGI